MNNLRAALTLTLGDQLTPGLGRMRQALERLRDIGRELRLGQLESASPVLRAAAADANLLTRSLARVVETADRVTAAATRAGHAVRNWGSKTFGPQSRIGAFGAVAGGYSLQYPLQGAADLSATLRTAAITAGKYGPDADAFMATLRARFTALAKETRQGSHSLANVGAWMLYNGYSPETMSAVLPGTARIATAYGADVLDVARVGESLGNTLQVKPAEINRALSILARLGKEGGFQFPDMARVMPKVASAAGQASMSGLGAVEDLAAAMQIILKGVPDREPQEAGTQLADLLQKIDAQPTRDAFLKHKVDIRSFLADAAMKGQSPLIAGLAAVQWVQRKVAREQRITDPKLRQISDDNIVKDLFSEKDSKGAASMLLRNVGEFKRLIALARGVDVSMVDRDFEERMLDDSVALTGLRENLTQTSDRIGTAFMPMVRWANGGLERMREAITGVDKRFPDLIDNTILTTGAVLALGTAIGVMGVVVPQVVAGLKMLWGVLSIMASPLGAVAIILGATAWHIMSNWETFEPFFADMWKGMQSMGRGYLLFMKGVFTADNQTAVEGLKTIWEGYKDYMTGLKGVLTTLFDDLRKKLDEWTDGGFSRTFDAISTAIGAVVDKIKEFIEWIAKMPGMGGAEGDGSGGGMGGYRHPRVLPPWTLPPIPQSFSPEGTLGGSTTIYIRAEPGTAVTRTEGDTRRVSVDPGTVLGRA